MNPNQEKKIAKIQSIAAQMVKKGMTYKKIWQDVINPTYHVSYNTFLLYLKQNSQQDGSEKTDDNTNGKSPP